MSVEAQKETLNFQAEVKELLSLMINAIYSNKQIFLRELISNASDAADKLRFEALNDNALFEDNGDLKIEVSFDKEKRTITIADNGIGMNRDEVINNLGTIAKSGTREFLSKLSGDQSKDSKLIGQFGVGFYASFIVADQVTVETRRAGLTPEHGVRWISDGKGHYSLENIDKPNRGTVITLHLKKDEDEFLNSHTLRSIVTKYSDHISLPIMMKSEPKEGEDNKPEWEQINRATTLWTEPKNKVTDEEYCELYKHISHDFQDPLAWSHNRVEGKNEYFSILYIPSQAPFDLYNREQQHGVKLYVKNVFIMDDAEQLLPMYLRFVKGVVDSRNLPLNISREILQNNRVIDNIRSGSVKKILGLLENLAKNEPEKYQTFWTQFGNVMKEGPAEDMQNKDRIAKLLRFSTTHSDSDKQTVSFDDYISRMKPEQDKIYYLAADTYLAAKHSPHLEVFEKNNIEVILMYDRVDEWLAAHLNEYEGKTLQSITQGDLDLGNLVSEEEKEKQKQEETDFASVVEQLKTTLGSKVKDVRVTHRLTASPACIVAAEDEMGLQMQRLMKAAGQTVQASAPILEINPEHRLIERLKSESDEDKFKEWAFILLDQAVLAEGGHLEDAANFVGRLNRLLLDVI